MSPCRCGACIARLDSGALAAKKRNVTRLDLEKEKERNGGSEREREGGREREREKEREREQERDLLNNGDETPLPYVRLYGVLQCVAVCCRVLQRVAACCSVLQRVAASWTYLL